MFDYIVQQYEASQWLNNNQKSKTCGKREKADEKKSIQQFKEKYEWNKIVVPISHKTLFVLIITAIYQYHILIEWILYDDILMFCDKDDKFFKDFLYYKWSTFVFINSLNSWVISNLLQHLKYERFNCIA